MSTFTPTPVTCAVRFLDDSPEDQEGGPIIYGVRLKVNGKYRDDIIPTVILDDVTRDRVTAITSVSEKGYIVQGSSAQRGRPSQDFLSIEGEIPKYGDYFYFMEHMRGVNSKNVEKNVDLNLMNQYYQLLDRSTKSHQANGNQSIVYLFDLASLTEKLNRVEAVITVANDYRIQTSMIHTRETAGGHDREGKNVGWYNSSYWRTAAQADGNVKDGSNVRTVKVDFGFQVASINYGFDADFNYRGFRIQGEIVANSRHYMFPDGTPGQGFPTDVTEGQADRTGHRWSQIDHSYYLKTQKDWDKIGFAGEIFKMGKFYRPYLDYYYPFPDREWRGGVFNVRNNTVRFPLIEDNDDNDMYPDTMIIQRSPHYFHVNSTFFSDDPDGVFPGNDEDHDGIPDNNKNNNYTPDYDEPFLMFDVDPDQFVFGNDYNNNTIPDFREDDMKMDTPYDFDRQGHHIFGRYSPIKNVGIFLGSLRSKGVGLANRTNENYFKLQLNYDVFDIGKLYAEYRYEDIHDNIRDSYIQVKTEQAEQAMFSYIRTGSKLSQFYTRELYYDELEYKNSRVNRLYLDSAIRAIPSVTLENHVKFERNEQVEGTMYDRTYQPHDVIDIMAIVSKIVYTKRWGNWTFSPGVKFRFYKKARSESVQPLDHYFMRIPLVMIKYMISSRTDITLGMQGVPGFNFQYRDLVQSHNDYMWKTYILQFQNRTDYLGYNVWGACGFTVDQLKYDEDYRKFEEHKTTSTFVKIYLGW
ncbi:hypothetical protein ACFL1R_03670 [Candidatus Latescibacterota bacterium]